MYVLLDRTEEATMRMKLQQGYLRLVHILQDLLNHEWSDVDMTSKEHLAEIKEKAQSLAPKYGL